MHALDFYLSSTSLQINSVVNIIVGNDVRKAISDGYPKENVFATDLRQGKRDHEDSSIKNLTFFRRVLGLGP